MTRAARWSESTREATHDTEALKAHIFDSVECGSSKVISESYCSIVVPFNNSYSEEAQFGLLCDKGDFRKSWESLRKMDNF